jgi:hypothetical protein
MRGTIPPRPQLFTLLRHVIPEIIHMSLRKFILVLESKWVPFQGYITLYGRPGWPWVVAYFRVVSCMERSGITKCEAVMQVLLQCVKLIEMLALTDWLTDWLTPWSRVLLEKLVVTQIVKKFSAFYGTRRFITVFTRTSHKSPYLEAVSSIRDSRMCQTMVTGTHIARPNLNMWK